MSHHKELLQLELNAASTQELDDQYKVIEFDLANMEKELVRTDENLAKLKQDVSSMAQTSFVISSFADHAHRASQ